MSHTNHEPKETIEKYTPRGTPRDLKRIHKVHRVSMKTIGKREKPENIVESKPLKI